MNVFKKLNKKKYNIPNNVSQGYSYKRYKKVIEKDWGKYLEALVRCGPFSMNQQFIELTKNLDQERDITDKYRIVWANSVIDELEKLRFISTDYLNNYKYIYLKHPAYALALGEYNHGYKISFKEDFNNKTFIDSILRVEYLLKHNDIVGYSNMHNQIYEITKMIYNLIVKHGNLYNYDIAAIERILSIGKDANVGLCQKVIKYINTLNEFQSKLGVIRVLWEHLGKEYWKIGRQRNTVSKEPYYLQLNFLENGEITIHYIAEIIIYDTNNSLDYYQSRNNIFFYMFFNMPSNNTENIAKNYKSNQVLGNKHDNIFGYKVKIIGFDESGLKKKANVINEPYGKNKYSPMVEKCDYVFLDIGKYLKKEKKKESSLFTEYERKIEEIIKKELN